MRTSVIAATRVVGFHYWPDAWPEVSYLSQPHRHVFHIKTHFDVTDDDREVEFHIAQSWIIKALSKMYPASELGYDFGARSCEMIAKEVGAYLAVHFRAPNVIEVWEDDEHGARVEF